MKKEYLISLPKGEITRTSHSSINTRFKAKILLWDQQMPNPETMGSRRGS